MSTTSKKKVCIWGAGWSGLTAALEISESSDCEVHIYEATDKAGGKVTGTVKDLDSLSTHAIRLISEYYPAFADVCSRVPVANNKTLLDRWSPLKYFNFYSKTKGKGHFIDRSIDKGLRSNLNLSNAVLFTFGLKFSDLLKIAKTIKKFRALDEEKIKQLEKDKLTIEKYLSVYELSDKAKYFLFTYLGITIAARPSSSAGMSLDLMSKMFVGVYRSKHLMSSNFKNHKSWVIDGPLGERLIPPFIEELKKRNVHFHMNSPLMELKQSTSVGATLALTNNNTEVYADAHILALNNKVIENLGLGRANKPLTNEWSVGAIFPMKRIPENLKHMHSKSVVAVMDSEWAIVFVIWSKQEQGGLWSNEVDFTDGYDYFLEIVASRLENKGSHNKSFFECDPDVAASEILKQIGLNDTKDIDEVKKHVKFSDNLSYTNSKNKDCFSLYSEPQDNGYYWKLYAPIYTSSPESLPFGVDTHYKNVFLCGEAIAIKYQYIKTPTLELASETAKEASQKVFDYLNINNTVDQGYPERFKKRQK